MTGEIGKRTKRIPGFVKLHGLHATASKAGLLKDTRNVHVKHMQNQSWTCKLAGSVMVACAIHKTCSLRLCKRL